MRAIGLCLTLLLLAAPATAEESLYEMPAGAFFDLEAVDASIPESEPDARLLSAAVLHATNQVRAEHDLRPLRYDTRLEVAAAGHARSMIEHDYLAHENPHDESMRLPMRRVLATGYKPRAVSENLAQVFRLQYESGRPFYMIDEDGRTIFSYEENGPPIPPHTYETLARTLLSEWMDSPGHRANVLRAESEELGVSVLFREKENNLDEAIAVQVFAQPTRR